MSKTRGRQSKSTKASRRRGRGDGHGRAEARSRDADPATNGRAASAEKAGVAQAEAVSSAEATGERPSTRPPGQRLFDMPYSSQVPSPVRPDLGLASLVARAGHNAGYDIDVTLLDAGDHRLIRTGVLLAHRVLDGRGEWYLGGPDWTPLLPAELIMPMGQAELPDELAELVRPFRRGAPLSPVAALRCERREFSLRNGDNQTVALLRDDKVTVRRNGLTTARYREVMLTSVGPGLDPAQADWLGQCLGDAGGTELDRFPRLVRRLGAPATGPSDLPVPADLTSGTFGQFLTQLLGAGVHDLIAGDLALTTGIPGAEQRLGETVAVLRGRLEGLREVLGPDWVSEAVDDLDWLVGPVEQLTGHRVASSRRVRGWDDPTAFDGPSAVAADDGPDIRPRWQGIRARLHSPRYLALLDRLVAAARAPRTGAGSAQPAAEGAESLYTAAVNRFVRAADRLAVEGTAQTWEAAWSAAGEVDRAAVIRALIDPDRTAKDRARFAPAFDLLQRITGADRESATILERIDELTPEDAFQAGRTFERDREGARALRSEFLTRWSKIRRKLAE